MTDLPEPLELPGPNGSVVPTTWRAQRATARLSAETVDRAAALARETGATPYMVLMAAFGALVHRYTHACDFLVATPVLNRGAGTEDAIGYYGNTLVMRMQPQPQLTFRELLMQTRDSAVGALRPLARRPGMAGARLQSRPQARRRANDPGELRITRTRRRRILPARGAVRACRAARPRQPAAAEPDDRIGRHRRISDGGALVEAEYLVEVLDRALVDQLLRHYGVLLDNALADPDNTLSACGLMSEADAEWLRRMSSGEDFTTPGQHAAGTGHAARGPDTRCRRSGLRRPPVQLSRDRRRSESVGPLADRAGHRHRGPRRGIAGQVT